MYGRCKNDFFHYLIKPKMYMTDPLLVIFTVCVWVLRNQIGLFTADII